MFVTIGCANNNAGFAEVITTDYNASACKSSDTYSIGFRGTNSNGKFVYGTVCCNNISCRGVY